MPIEITPDLMLVLASALSLRTTWVTPFNELVRRFHDGPWSGGSWHWLERVDGLPRRRTAEYDDAAWLTTVVPGDADVDVLLGVGQPQNSAGRRLGGADRGAGPTAYPEAS